MFLRKRPLFLPDFESLTAPPAWSSCLSSLISFFFYLQDFLVLCSLISCGHAKSSSSWSMSSGSYTPETLISQVQLLNRCHTPETLISQVQLLNRYYLHSNHKTTHSQHKSSPSTRNNLQTDIQNTQIIQSNHLSQQLQQHKALTILSRWRNLSTFMLK